VAAPRAWIEPRPERAFLLLAVGAPVLVTVAAHPEIGAFRDWDAFSLAAVPLTVMAALILPGSDRGASPAAAVVIVVVSLLHTLPWIAVHADAELAERRFVACLQNLELSPAARAYGWETLGVHRREQGDDRAAHEAFAAALEANPGNHRYWNDLGTTAARLGDETAAIDSYARALELHPEATAIRLNLADAYRRAGRDQEGRSAYEQVLARDPRSGRAAYYAGTLSLRLGDRTRARQHFRHVLAIDPSFEKAEALRRWLQEDAVP
jgi:cytochrome c-type biogenesis protein CcmH/NrfG